MIFYDAMDSEHFVHQDPVDAIEEALEIWADKDDIKTIIKKHAPIIVSKYEPEEVTNQHISEMALRMVETFAEMFQDNFGEPDNYHDNGLNSTVLGELALKIACELRKTVDKHARVWICRKIGEKKYSAKDLEQILQEERPELFEEDE